MSRQFCSQLNHTEAMWGTAEPVDVWLLLEYKPTWRTKTVTDNDLAKETKRWLEATVAGIEAAGFKVRPQFVRQPELARADTRLLVGVDERLLHFSGVGYDFLQDLDVLSIIQAPHQYPQLSEPQYFVCTNGQRDLCCSKFGLPSYHALRQRVGERAWQTSHLGGHRFAPNVLVFPQGVLYGRVTLESVDEFLAATEAHDVDFSHLRGRARYPAHVQAAEAALGVSGLKLLHVAGDDKAAQVTFAGSEDLLKTSVKRAVEPLSVLKSCSADETELVYPYFAS